MAFTQIRVGFGNLNHGLCHKACTDTNQTRAPRIISPGETYEDACVALSLPSLKERRDTLCKYFLMICLTQTIDLTTCFQIKDN